MELELAWRDRQLDGAPGRTPRRFLDFCVDGQSLYEAIGEDLISCPAGSRPISDRGPTLGRGGGLCPTPLTRAGPEINSKKVVMARAQREPDFLRLLSS